MAASAENAAKSAGAAALMASMGLPTFAAGGGVSSSSSAGPATATGINTITPAFDASNWTVATSGSKSSPTNSSGGGVAVPWMLVAGAALIGVLLWKRL